MSRVVPRRCCLCLGCRTALLPGTDCDCESAGAVACFEVGSEREEMYAAAWGHRLSGETPDSLQRARRRLGTWRMIGGYLKAALGTENSEVPPIGGEFVVGNCSESLRGTLKGEHGLYSPAQGHECLAYSLQLCLLWQGRELLMYQDTITSGLQLRLGSGEEIALPAGRLRFTGKAPEIVNVDNLELEAYLDSVDPLRETEGLSPIRFNIVREEVLYAGDLVDLCGDFQLTPLTGHSLSYRTQARSRLCCNGIAQVGRVR